MTARSIVIASLVCAGAWAAPPSPIAVGDLPGTSGRWQVGEAVVAAPPATVQRWLSDYAAWPARFPDVEWAQPDGKGTVRFRSRVLGRTMTIHVRNKPGLITYDGEGKDVVTQGKIYIVPAENGTRVTMQTTAEVHGLAGAFATAKLKRDRALEKLRVDLTALVRLAHDENPAPR